MAGASVYVAVAIMLNVNRRTGTQSIFFDLFLSSHNIISFAIELNQSVINELVARCQMKLLKVLPQPEH
jgi:hypothetical protein